VMDLRGRLRGLAVADRWGIHFSTVRLRFTARSGGL
jgi:hypothetical protein